MSNTHPYLVLACNWQRVQCLCRYTPLLAWLLVPNSIVHPAFGKALFCMADLAAAFLLHHLVKAKVHQLAGKHASMPELHVKGSLHRSKRSIPTLATAAWLFNPYTATISTRGNGDSLVVLMQLATLALLPVAHSSTSSAQSPHQEHHDKHQPVTLASLDVHASLRSGSQQRLRMPLLQRTGWIAAAGAVFGLLVHWRIFPVLYGPSLVVYFWAQAGKQPPPESDRPDTEIKRLSMQRVQMPGAHSAPLRIRLVQWLTDCATFGAAALLVFAGLGWLCYQLYGQAFLHEAFLYHASRQDPRHNFSPHFLFCYLHHFSGDDAAVPHWRQPGVLALPCMLAAILAVAVRAHEQAELAMLLTTMAFVTFNKVVTAQYFVWYFGLLPLLLPELVQSWGAVQSAAAAAWLMAQLLWLGAGYLLEFQVDLAHTCYATSCADTCLPVTFVLGCTCMPASLQSACTRCQRLWCAMAIVASSHSTMISPFVCRARLCSALSGPLAWRSKQPMHSSWRPLFTLFGNVKQVPTHAKSKRPEPRHDCKQLLRAAGARQTTQHGASLPQYVQDDNMAMRGKWHGYICKLQGTNNRCISAVQAAVYVSQCDEYNADISSACLVCVQARIPFIADRLLGAGMCSRCSIHTQQWTYALRLHSKARMSQQ